MEDGDIERLKLKEKEIITKINKLNSELRIRKKQLHKDQIQVWKDSIKKHFDCTGVIDKFHSLNKERNKYRKNLSILNELYQTSMEKIYYGNRIDLRWKKNDDYKLVFNYYGFGKVRKYYWSKEFATNAERLTGAIEIQKAFEKAKNVVPRKLSKSKRKLYKLISDFYLSLILDVDLHTEFKYNSEKDIKIVSLKKDYNEDYILRTSAFKNAEIELIFRPDGMVLSLESNTTASWTHQRYDENIEFILAQIKEQDEGFIKYLNKNLEYIRKANRNNQQEIEKAKNNSEFMAYIAMRKL